MKEILACILGIIICIALPLVLGLLDWHHRITRYNKTNSIKLKHTSVFKANRRYETWYLANFCDLEDNNAQQN